MFGVSEVREYSCGPNANYLIEKWFGDCIYTTWDAAAFCIGLSSVFFWIIAQLPQFVSNFVRSAADALSPWFLAQWLAGDTFNFLGCVLTGNQLKTQTITAGYFIFSDVIIITQYIYYQIKNRNAVDFDESIHKGSAYSDVLKSHATKDPTLEKQSHHDTACQDFEAGLLGSTEQDNLRNCSSKFLLDDAVSSNQSVNTATHSRNRPSKGMGRALEASDGTHLLKSFLPSSQQQDSWMYEHRHRLRRLVQEYGLEYGHAAAIRVTSLYKSKRKDKYSTVHSRSSRGAHQNLAFLKKPRYKAVLGIAGLFGLVSTTNLQRFSSTSTVGGFTLGRRSLLALHDTGAILTSKSVLMEVGQPTAVYLVDQLSLLSQHTYSWVGVIGTCLGWCSSALYLGSRLSQLVKNKQRRSADGLSLGMVMCAVLANLTYGTSIVMRGPSWYAQLIFMHT